MLSFKIDVTNRIFANIISLTGLYSDIFSGRSTIYWCGFVVLLYIQQEETKLTHTNYNTEKIGERTQLNPDFSKNRENSSENRGFEKSDGCKIGVYEKKRGNNYNYH